MRLATLLSICSYLIVSGCANGPARPDTSIYQIIVSAQGSEAFGYNMKTDYDENGNLLPSAQAKTVPLQDLTNLRGWYCTDLTGMSNLKIYLGSVRDYARNHCQ